MSACHVHYHLFLLHQFILGCKNLVHVRCEETILSYFFNTNVILFSSCFWHDMTLWRFLCSTLKVEKFVAIYSIEEVKINVRFILLKWNVCSSVWLGWWFGDAWNMEKVIKLFVIMITINWYILASRRDYYTESPAMHQIVTRDMNIFILWICYLNGFFSLFIDKNKLSLNFTFLNYRQKA